MHQSKIKSGRRELVVWVATVTEYKDRLSRHDRASPARAYLEEKLKEAEKQVTKLKQQLGRHA